MSLTITPTEVPTKQHKPPISMPDSSREGSRIKPEDFNIISGEPKEGWVELEKNAPNFTKKQLEEFALTIGNIEIPTLGTKIDSIKNASNREHEDKLFKILNGVRETYQSDKKLELEPDIVAPSQQKMKKHIQSIRKAIIRLQNPDNTEQQHETTPIEIINENNFKLDFSLRFRNGTEGVVEMALVTTENRGNKTYEQVAMSDYFPTTEPPPKPKKLEDEFAYSEENPPEIPKQKYEGYAPKTERKEKTTY